MTDPSDRESEMWLNGNSPAVACVLGLYIHTPRVLLQRQVVLNLLASVHRCHGCPVPTAQIACPRARGQVLNSFAVTALFG